MRRICNLLCLVVIASLADATASRCIRVGCVQRGTSETHHSSKLLATTQHVAVVQQREPIPRILIVGDSWAASITAEHVDPLPSPDVFDDVLAAHGLGQFETRGEKTAWGGRKASDWAAPEHVETIRSELEVFPAIDYVHLIIGGNDFLSTVLEKGPKLEDEVFRERTWRRIVRDIETIIETCHGVREGITVVIAGYDYLDYRAAEAFWKFKFHDIDTETLNGWLKELGEAKRGLALRTANCVYVDNWGVLQRAFGEAGEIGPAHGMPAAITPDGVHPNAEGHAILLENAFNTVYRDALAAEAVP